MTGLRTPRWLRHPVRTFLDWLGGLVIDRVFAHEDELRRIAVYNETRLVTRDQMDDVVQEWYREKREGSR